jgi:hypothetical protein
MLDSHFVEGVEDAFDVQSEVRVLKLKADERAA